jgi:PII-like signaling protein
MSRPKTTDDLTDNENFWAIVDSQEQKDFHNAMVLDMIRGFNGSTDIDRIEFVAKLKFCVNMIDAPRDIYQSLQRSKETMEQQAATEKLLSEE